MTTSSFSDHENTLGNWNMSAANDHKHGPAPNPSVEVLCQQSRELRAKTDALLLDLKATIRQAQALCQQAAALVKSSVPLKVLPPSLPSREEGQFHSATGQNPSTTCVPSLTSVDPQDTSGNTPCTLGQGGERSGQILQK
jgi:hypothetical protein